MAYSTSFKNRMVERILEPGGISVSALAREVGVAKSTLLGWRDQALEGGSMSPKRSSRKGGRRGSRPPGEKIRIVMEAAGLSDDELGAFLRKEGLHEAELERLRREVFEAAQQGFEAHRKRGPSAAEKELKQVKKELARKEKALAETAAILVLRGKLEAFLSGDEEGDTTNKNER